MRNRPKQVRAAILVEQNRDLVIDEIELPTVLYDCDVLLGAITIIGISLALAKF